jgi:hypothetical protein
VSVEFKSKNGTAIGIARFERVRAGVCRGALPWGEWDLTVFLSGLYRDRRLPADAKVSAGLEVTLAFTVPAGGAIVVYAAPGVEETRASIRPVTDAADRDRGRFLLLATRDGTRIEGIPPGRYEIDYERRYDSSEVSATVRVREVTVVTGGVEEVRLPPP